MDLLALEREFLGARELSLTERAEFWLSRWSAVARDKRRVWYLGREFVYDGRLLPLLLPAYLADCARLDRLVSLRRATVVDVGANVGQFGATLARRFPEATVWSFEPNQVAFDLLTQNAAGSPGWTVVPWGVADEDQEASLWVLEGHSAQGSVYRSNAASGLGLRGDAIVEHLVDLKRLTAERRLALGIPALVDLLKVDVEGAEPAALAGLADIRWRYLVIETSLAREGGLTVAEACDLCVRIWGHQPEVLWTSTPAPDATTMDALLSFAEVEWK